jgi:glycosyltransferase involved in cell wall biosynthesis
MSMKGLGVVDESAVSCLVASSQSVGREPPFLTVAIPHYQHRRYLEIVLESIFSQNTDRFEIVVSDDCSPDDSNQVIPDILQKSGRPFRYYAQPINLGYDGNVRFCLAAAQGEYVLLLGNDDALARPDALRRVAVALWELGGPAVAFTNHIDYASGVMTRRAQDTSLLGNGPDTAIRFFRTFSFVSGLVFARHAALQHETDIWDGSIYYQIYLASRIVAYGGDLAAIDECTIRKDVRLDGQTVPNYATKWAGAPWSFASRHTGLDSVIRVTAAAVLPALPEKEHSEALRRIIGQILTISYPHWLFEYRRVANWSTAVGVARGMWPHELLSEYDLAKRDRIWLWSLYGAVTVSALLFPASLFVYFRTRLADWVRRHQQSLAPSD